jgi:hypothetical protein
MSVAFLLIAVLIALVANFGEILSKNESRIIRDIVNRYLFIYLIINGFFAGIVYYFLPDIAKFVLKPEYTSWAQGDTWGRVLIAAFGYLVIVRAKFITIKDTPIGIDTLYDTFAQYCLRHTNMRIMIRQDRILDSVFQKFNQLAPYQSALDNWIPNAPANEQETIRSQRDTILASTLANNIKCKRLGQLLLRIVGSQDELERALTSAVPPPPLPPAALNP